MTNTYPDDAPIEIKILEELRIIRCAMERLMRIMDEGMFVDYQLEKFSTPKKAPAAATPCPTCAAIVESWDEHDDHWDKEGEP